MNEVRVIEVFQSLQGEGTRAGLPCAFVRLAGCNLNCRYCDSRYACDSPGKRLAVDALAERVRRTGRRLVCVTGGEPLLQPGAFGLVRLLTAGGVTVVVETNGTVDFSDLPPEAVCIMDVKCPGSGEEGHTLRSNLEALRSADEVKFVLCDRADFDWAAQFVRRYKLAERCAVLMSPARGFLEGRDLAAWILESGLHARLQLQLHRILWPEIERGV